MASQMLKIIKKDKDIGKVVLDNFEEKDINILSFMINSMKNEHHGDMVIDFKRFKNELVQDTAEEAKFVEALIDIGQRMAMMAVAYETDGVYGVFHVFKQLEISKENKVFAVKIDDFFKKHYKELIDIRTQYLMNCIALGTKESKGLYWILNQDRNKGKSYISLERLKEIFGIASSNVLSEKVLKEEVDKLKTYFSELRFRKVTSGSQYKRTKGYEFTFKVERKMSAYDYESLMALEMQTGAVKKQMNKPYILIVEE